MRAGGEMVEKQADVITPQGTEERFRNTHQQFLAEQGQNGDSQASQQRTTALLRFLGQGLPTRKDEDWKYTDLKPLRTTAFELPPSSDPKSDPGALKPDVERIGVAGSHRLVFVNGRLADGLSAHAELPAGLSLRTLESALLERPGDPARFENAFTALNTAFLERGFEITVAAGVEVSRPIELIYLSTSSGSPFMAQLRVRVTLEAGARATVLEQFIALDEVTQFNNLVCDVEVGAGAALQHARLLDEGEQGCNVAVNRVRVDRDAHYGYTTIQLGGRILREDLKVVLDGAGAHTDLFGLYRLGGNSHADNHTVIDHAKGNTTSREFYKGILEGAASGAFFGRIVVREQAQKINAKQTNNNLLLSADARVDSTPQLEIYADDVQCRHGSTIGRLDENMLFYLRSRGISKERARDLLTYAFANEIIDTLPIPELRERLATRLMRETGHDPEPTAPEQEQRS